VDVCDSNVWVWGLTEKAPAAVTKIDEIRNGDRYIAISAYIHGEVTEAFDRATTASGNEIREMKKEFNVLVSKRHNVEFPGHDAIGQMDIYEARRQQPVQLLASAWSIQAKDVPVVMFAEQLPDESTVFTTDGPLADFNPADFEVNGVIIEHIPTP